jgi:hypothetical protein
VKQKAVTRRAAEIKIAEGHGEIIDKIERVYAALFVSWKKSGQISNPLSHSTVFQSLFNLTVAKYWGSDSLNRLYREINSLMVYSRLKI